MQGGSDLSCAKEEDLRNPAGRVDGERERILSELWDQGASLRVVAVGVERGKV